MATESLEEAHRDVMQHLERVSCVDERLAATVHTYRDIARSWHSSVYAVASELLATGARRNLSRLLACVQECEARQHPPPPFLVDFEQDFVNSWARRVGAAAAQRGGEKWSPAQRQELGSKLKHILRAGLCHKQHVTVVDAGSNPAWLSEYVRSVVAIWQDAAGEATPATIQRFKKLASCTSEAVSVICEYAQIVLEEREADAVERALRHVQSVACSSFGGSGVSNASATKCIGFVRLQPHVFALLAKVDALLVTVWDLITNPRSAECCYLPGVAGSHAHEFAVPAVAVARGSPTVVANCVKSALPLTFVNPGADHAVSVASDALSGLDGHVVDCLDSMLRVERFGGEEGCRVEWWAEYMRLARVLLDAACAALRVHPRVSAATEPRAASSMLCELRAQCDHYVASKVSKVRAAIKLFRCTLDVASGTSTNVKVPVAAFQSVFDAETEQERDDPSLAGRLLADVGRVVAELGADCGVQVDTKYRVIVFRAPSNAEKMLHVLLEYMEEHSKSRRKRGESVMLKRNARPEHDKRKRPRAGETEGA